MYKVDQHKIWYDSDLISAYTTNLLNAGFKNIITKRFIKKLYYNKM